MKKKIIAVILTITTILLLTVGCTGSQQRGIKSVKPNLTGGLHRTITLYDYNGKEIRKWEGKIDLSEAEKTDGLIRRYQDKKKMLETRVKKNEELLYDLKNRKTVLTIEAQIGTMDETKLARLKNILEAYEDSFEDEDRKETEDEGESDHSPALEE